MAAIYGWYGSNVLLLTTTLYPVDVDDSMELSITINIGSMTLIPLDNLETSHEVMDGLYVQERWFYSDGPYEDSLETSQIVMDGTYVQERWFYSDGPYDDSIDTSHEVMNGSYVNKRVEADTPDEELQLAISIDSSCTMEAI